MVETSIQSLIPSVLDIQRLIAAKTWYGKDSEGHFSWAKSVEALAKSLDLSPNCVESIVSSCFGPNCLSQVQVNETKQQPLLASLAEIPGLETQLWTEGDVLWQQEKLIRTGARKYLDPKMIHIFGSAKVNGLGALLDERLRKRRIPERVFVADDKRQNLEAVQALAATKKWPFRIENFCVNLSSPQADATAFYSWLKRHHNGSSLLYLDYDGVAANTDQVIFESVPPILLQKLIEESRLKFSP